MAVNSQTLEGNWNQIKGKLRERWGQVSGDDLQKVRGDVDQLVGLIQKKTGEARDKVEQYLNELTSEGASTANRAMHAARDFAGQAYESAEDAAARAADMMRGGYMHTERMIQQRPFESLAVGFGAGLIAGVVVGLMMRSSR